MAYVHPSVARPAAQEAASAPALRHPLRALLLAGGVIFLAAAFPVLQASAVTQRSDRLLALQQRQDDLHAQVHSLEAEVAQLGSLQRIDSEARGRLGMVPANRALSVSVDVPAPEPGHLPASLQVATPPPEHSSGSILAQILNLLPLP